PIAKAVRSLLRVDDARDDTLCEPVNQLIAGRVQEVLRLAVAAALPDGPSAGGSAPQADADRSRVIDGVAALLAGTPASPGETFFIIRRFLAAFAREGPVVLAIDDLQWAEPLLLDLVEHLVQWGGGVPLLVLAAARPELRDTRSSLAAA